MISEYFHESSDNLTISRIHVAIYLKLFFNTILAKDLKNIIIGYFENTDEIYCIHKTFSEIDSNYLYHHRIPCNIFINTYMINMIRGLIVDKWKLYWDQLQCYNGNNNKIKGPLSLMITFNDSNLFDIDFPVINPTLHHGIETYCIKGYSIHGLVESSLIFGYCDQFKKRIYKFNQNKFCFCEYQTLIYFFATNGFIYRCMSSRCDAFRNVLSRIKHFKFTKLN